MILGLALGLIGAKLLAEWVLSTLNRREVVRHAERAPEAVAAIMTPEAYRQAVAYTLAKNTLHRRELVWEALILGGVLATGVLPWWQAVCGATAGAPVWREALFLITTVIGLSLPGLPWEWYAQFRVEERFGFNKSTPALWWMDKVKGTALGLALGGPLVWGLLALIRSAGTLWWVWGFALVFGFQLLMLVLYPKVILPWFNKLTPLPEGELKTRLLALGERTGFKAATIEVIDGSKRSGHSNAYFTGFGRFRRIVLFDTLMAQLTPEELEAVLAHEVGHYRCGHIPRMLAVAAAMMLGGFGAMAWLQQSAWFGPAFGFAPGDAASTFLLFVLLSGVLTFWRTPLGNLMSRRHEY